MPKVIAQNRITRNPIPKNRIAQPPAGAVAAAVNAQEPFTFPGSVGNQAAQVYSFTPPITGYWKFVLWGAGFCTAGGQGGDSGSYLEVTRFVSNTQVVTISVGRPNNQPTSVTFPDLSVATAGNATGAGGVGKGVATGGDVMLGGSAGATGSAAAQAGLGTGGGPGGGGTGTGTGAGAPANLPYRGGRGGVLDSGGFGAATPGGGGTQSALGPAGAGSGFAIAVFMHL